MGLDYVELVLAIEDRFQIHISDEEAGSVTTVGDLYQVVLSKLEPEKTFDQSGLRRCLTSAAFYRTRRGIMEALEVNRRAVRPSTAFDTLLPWHERRRFWKTFQSKVGLKLPRLCHPVWVHVGLLLAGALAAAILARASGEISSLSVLVLLSVGGGGLLLLAARPLAVGLPGGVVTVGDLTKEVLAVNYARLLREVGRQSRQDVWAGLCAVMIEQLGLSPEHIQPEAKILDDLGID